MVTHSLLPATWDVPQIFRDRLGATVGRQRTMSAEGHLLLVLHLPPKPNDAERQGRFLWRKPDGSWFSNDLGSGAQAVTRHLDEYSKAVEACERGEEQAQSAEDYFLVLEQLAPISRSTRNLHSVLQEARQLFPTDRNLINFRDRSYEIERTAELLQAETRNSWDLLMARKADETAQASQRMAASAHRLNLLAAFFFPTAVLSGIFGVNLVHGWESHSSPTPFWGFVAVSILSGFVLMLFIAAANRK